VKGAAKNEKGAGGGNAVFWTLLGGGTGDGLLETRSRRLGYSLKESVSASSIKDEGGARRGGEVSGKWGGGRGELEGKVIMSFSRKDARPKDAKTVRNATRLSLSRREEINGASAEVVRY